MTLASPHTRGDVYTRLILRHHAEHDVYLTLNWSQVGPRTFPIPTPGWVRSRYSGHHDAQVATPAADSTVTSFCPPAPFNAGQLLQAPAFSAAPRLAAPTHSCRPQSTRPVLPTTSLFRSGLALYGLGPQDVYTQRDNRRLVGGANGTFNLFDTDWTWKGYYEHGENDTNIHVRGIALKPYIYAAIDSVQVTAANQATYRRECGVGTIVCRSAVADRRLRALRSLRRACQPGPEELALRRRQLGSGPDPDFPPDAGCGRLRHIRRADLGLGGQGFGRHRFYLAPGSL